MELTVSETPAPAVESAPVIPASDFNAVSVAPSVIRGNIPVPEPGTLFAGIGVLAYLVLKTGRRSSRH